MAPVEEGREIIKSVMVPLVRMPVKTNLKRSTSHDGAEKQPRIDAEKHLCLHVELNFNENTECSPRLPMNDAEQSERKLQHK